MRPNKNNSVQNNFQNSCDVVFGVVVDSVCQ